MTCPRCLRTVPPSLTQVVYASDGDGAMQLRMFCLDCAPRVREETARDVRAMDGWAQQLETSSAQTPVPSWVLHLDSEAS